MQYALWYFLESDDSLFCFSVLTGDINWCAIDTDYLLIYSTLFEAK